MAAQYDPEYDFAMERITATFDKKTAAAIRRVAGKRGVSAFLQEAAREHLARLEILELLDDLNARYGAPTPEERAAVERELDALFGPAKRRTKRWTRNKKSRGSQK
jgi:hypothetical protein